jgi:hypothetical protein
MGYIKQTSITTRTVIRDKKGAKKLKKLNIPKKNNGNKSTKNTKKS